MWYGDFSGHGGPTEKDKKMIGSEKKIEWATEIKAEVEAAIASYIMPKAEKGTPAQRAQLDSAIGNLAHKAGLSENPLVKKFLGD